MTRHPTAAITGTVTRTHHTGTTTLVDLHIAPHLRGHLIVTGRNQARAAARWHAGDRVTAWGWAAPPDLHHPDPVIVATVHTIQRHRPGHRTNPLDPDRRLTPRQRNRRRIAEIIQREIGAAERLDTDAHELDDPETPQGGGAEQTTRPTSARSIGSPATRKRQRPSGPEPSLGAEVMRS